MRKRRVLAMLATILPLQALAQAPPLNVEEVAASLDCSRVFPQPETLAGSSSFTYATVPGRDLRMHVFAPAEAARNRSAILFFFGGAWSVGTVEAFHEQAQAFAARGYVAPVADYRVSCRDGTTAVEALTDAQAAYRWLEARDRDFGFDRARLVLSGGSAGGHLALAPAQLAADGRRPAALVLFNPVVDLVTATLLMQALKLPAADAARISPGNLPVRDLPPTLIVHGTADRTAPFASVRDFCDRASTAGRICTVEAFADQDHGFFNRRQRDPGLGVSPYEAALAKAMAFLDALGLSGRPAR